MWADSGENDIRPKICHPRRCAQGLGAKRGPRVDLPPRGITSAAPALFRRPRRRARRFDCHRSPDVEFHVDAPMDTVGTRPAAEAGHLSMRLALIGPTTCCSLRLCPAGMRSGRVRFRSVPSQTGVIGHRLLILGAGWVVFGKRAPGWREGDHEKRKGCGASGHRRQLRSAAPVRFETSATIFDIAASISTSVSVRSRGCSVT